jgi:geranylgeranyl pyrophosphate synthase
MRDVFEEWRLVVDREIDGCSRGRSTLVPPRISSGFDSLEAGGEFGKGLGNDVREVVDILREPGSVEYARQRALEFFRRAREWIEPLDLAPDSAGGLAAFTRFVVERDV